MTTEKESAKDAGKETETAKAKDSKKGGRTTALSEKERIAEVRERKRKAK